MADFDRYFYYRNNGNVDQLPFVNIPVSSSDRYEEWRDGQSRMDVMSQKYYNDPLFDWVILQANPQYVLEFDIPDGEIIRIPYPLESVLKLYDDTLKNIRNF